MFQVWRAVNGVSVGLLMVVFRNMGIMNGHVWQPLGHVPHCFPPNSGCCSGGGNSKNTLMGFIPLISPGAHRSCSVGWLWQGVVLPGQGGPRCWIPALKAAGVSCWQVRGREVSWLQQSPHRKSQHGEENKALVPLNCENCFLCGCKWMGDILIYQVRICSNVQ